MIAYKWFCSDLTTFNHCQWALEEWKEVSGDGKLCGPGWLHAFPTLLLAVLHKPACLSEEYNVLCEIEYEGCVRDEGFKLGATRMRPLRQIEPPQVTTEQIVEYAIRVSQEALCLADVSIPVWKTWAEKWLSGEDRTAHVAADAARAAAYAALAARAAALAADAARAARAAADAADAARAAADAALAAANAARAAALAATDAAVRIDLAAIAERVCKK